jgi:hypothetical protein
MAKSSQPKLFSMCTRTNIRVTTPTHDSVRKRATTVTVGALEGVLSIGIPGAPPPGGPPVDMIVLKNYTNPRGIVGKDTWRGEVERGRRRGAIAGREALK